MPLCSARCLWLSKFPLSSVSLSYRTSKLGGGGGGGTELVELVPHRGSKNQFLTVLTTLGRYQNISLVVHNYHIHLKYKLAMVRKWRNQKEIPTAQTEGWEKLKWHLDT